MSILTAPPVLPALVLVLAIMTACDRSTDSVQTDPALSQAAATTVAARDTLDTRAAVAAAVERFHVALAGGDSLAALQILHPDAIIVEAGGVESLEEYRGGHLPADIAFAARTSAERAVVRITLRDDVAWVVSQSIVRTEGRGSQGAELMVLSRDAAGWRIEAIHWSSRQLRE